MTRLVRAARAVRVFEEPPGRCSRRSLARYQRLAAWAARLAARDSVARTSPEASLEEAAAAGWSPT